MPLQRRSTRLGSSRNVLRASASGHPHRRHRRSCRSTYIHPAALFALSQAEIAHHAEALRDYSWAYRDTDDASDETPRKRMEPQARRMIPSSHAWRCLKRCGQRRSWAKTSVRTRAPVEVPAFLTMGMTSSRYSTAPLAGRSARALDGRRTLSSRRKIRFVGVATQIVLRGGTIAAQSPETGADLRTIATQSPNARRPIMNDGHFHCGSDHRSMGSCPPECRDHPEKTTPWRQDRDDIEQALHPKTTYSRH